MIDNGSYTEVARRLARDFGEVRYYAPWQGPATRSNEIKIGDGIDGVERIFDYHDVIDKTDLWVFPDVYWSGLQDWLARQGARVWGSRDGDELELYRFKTKKLFTKLGIEVGQYEIIKGMDALREYLKKHDDQWIKLDLTRGDTETFHSENYDIVEEYLFELEHRMGPMVAEKRWIVEAAINDAVEAGIDTFNIDGKYPEHCYCGIEVKDLGYTGRWKKYRDCPKEVLKVHDALDETFAKYNYRNFFSSEVRIPEEGVGFPVDMTCRQPCPPGDIYQLWENYSEVLWGGAGGEVVEPICKKEWAAEILIKTSSAESNWLNISVPEKIRDNVKLKYNAVIDGKNYIVPQYHGWTETAVTVIATGDTLEDALFGAKEFADEIKGFYLEIPKGSLDQAEAEIEKLAEKGVKI